MWRITLFGVTRVTTDEGQVIATGMGGTKPRQILEVLALSAGTPVPKDQLAEALWGARPPATYLGTLESYVCVLRRELGLGRGRASTLATVSRGYVLDLDDVEVDLVDFRRLAREAEGLSAEPRRALRALQDALGLVGGDLLASEAYESWAVTERETFGRELVAAATLAATHALAVGEHETAARLARRAIAEDALAEHAWCLLMRALWVGGRTSEALRAYLEVRSRLATELGTDPSVACQDLYLQILRDAPAEGRTGSDAREEVRVLLHLLRRAVGAVPGLPEPTDDRTLVRVATELVA